MKGFFTSATGVHGFCRRLISLTRKEIRQLLRDRGNLLIGIGLPIVLIFIFGYGLSLDVHHGVVAVVQDDASMDAHRLLETIRSSDYLQPIPVTSLADGERLMASREVDALVFVPADFSRRLNLGEAKVLVLLQGADATRASTVGSYLEQALGLWQQKQAARDPGLVMKGVQIEQRIWFNAANASTWYLVPGLIVLIMTLVGAFLTALLMAREWERGTLEALFVSPVHSVEVLIAKIIPCFLVGMLGLVLCLLAARFLFHIPMYGSLWVLLFSSTLYLLVALGIGLLISAITKNQFLASQLALLASFLPAMMLSGFIFDLRNIPPVMQFLGHLLPATYFMELVKSLFLAGDFWPLIIRNCFILFGFAVVLLGLACLATRKRLD